MRTHDETAGGRGLLTGLAILLVGIAIGYTLDLDGWRAGRAGSELDTVHSGPAERTGPFRPDATGTQQTGTQQTGTQQTGDAAPDNGLETIRLSFADDAVETLQRSHERATARERVVQAEDDVVSARLEHAGVARDAKVRIKGDLVDHIDTDKWSLRIELEDGTLFGMSRLSIQHPKTRGFLWGWLVLAAARHDGLLAPRARFVNVVVNGRPNGVYELEEHFSKELLESQGRREGPIIRFDEDAHWSLDLTLRTAESRLEPSELTTSADVLTAEIAAFGERRLSRDSALSRQLQSAIGKMRELQRLMVTATADARLHADVDHAPGTREERMRRTGPKVASSAAQRLQSAAEQSAQTVEELLDVERFARMTALLSLLGGEHGLTWHNMRFYHDPMTERLEPVVFDAVDGMVGTTIGDPYVWGPRLITRVLAKSPRYYLATFRALREFMAPGWLEELLESTGADLDRYAGALQAEGLLPGAATVERMQNLLYQRQAELRRLLRPAEAVNFLCTLEEEDVPSPGDESSAKSEQERVRGTVVVEAWGTTRVPVRLRGFRLGNGAFLTAASVRSSAHADGPRFDGGIDDGDDVILPWDGRRVRFAFPVDTRLATLREIRQVTEAVKQRSERDRSVRLTLDAEYSLVTAPGTRSERLQLRRFRESAEELGQRPALPTLAEALASHPFLVYELASNRLSIAPGHWNVEGDLIVPTGHALYAGPGVALRFQPDAVLLAGSPLIFAGSAEAPITLGPAEGTESWSGIAVLDSQHKSSWSQVTVRGAREIQRGGWMSTGGVSFYRSAVELRDCRFEDARGEDALNVFGADLLLERVVFRGSVSDAFDGDFVTGTVRQCEFHAIQADALDTSGSRLTIENCSFTEIGDKGISAGEASTLTVRGGSVRGASIGVASKDGSHVVLEGLAIQDSTHFALAAYVKKPAYGVSTIVASHVQLVGDAAPAIVQSGCEVSLDGILQPTRDLNVEALYRQKILGR